MARITDQRRVDRLKNSTMKLVAQKGYGGASAVLIAADAKVATGYFYLHYKGKYELVHSLLTEVYQQVADKLGELIEQGSSFKILIENLVGYIFTMANREPMKVRFFYVVTTDYRFKFDQQIRESVYHFIQTIMDIGYKEGELDKKLTKEDMYHFIVMSTIQYINHKFKNAKKRIKFSKADEEHFFYLLLKILK